MSIIEAVQDPRVFGSLFPDPTTWKNWRVCLKAIFGLELTTEEEVAIYQKFTGRELVPDRPFKEVFLAIGRRGGKSFISALTAVYLAVFGEWDLGIERGFILCIAVDKIQASIVLNYVREILQLPAFKNIVASEFKEEIQLKNGITIMVKTASYRSLRGFAICACVLDEVAFYRSEGANPDREILTALRPAMGNIANSLLLAISTVYSKSGILFDSFKDYYAKSDDLVHLFWKASTRDMNPTYDQQTIDREIERDSAAARAEFFSEFRADLENYISTEALDQVIVPGRFELPYVYGLPYRAFVDPSGGRQDAMTMSICHDEDGKIVQDCLRIERPPFNPTEAVKKFCETLASYNISSVTGDRYSGEWVVEAFRKYDITYENADRNKSELYLEFLPLVMTGSVELLDHKQQKIELRQLERRSGSGRDSVDHPKGPYHDDLANACAGACVVCTGAGKKRGALIFSRRDAYGQGSPFDSDFGLARVETSGDSSLEDWIEDSKKIGKS